VRALSFKLAAAPCLLLFLVSIHARGALALRNAPAHWVNSADPHADDAGPGTLARPWMSLVAVNAHRLQAGESLYFARGSSYSGAILIKDSGTAKAPIKLTAYGRGAAPRFTNPQSSNLSGNMIQVHGSWIVIDGLCFHDGVPAAPTAPSSVARTIAAVWIAATAQHVVVTNCEAMNCPVAVRVYGEYALITRNYFHDTTNQFLCSPNWGPVAVMLMVSNLEASYNRIEHYYMVGGSWGADGGAFEIDGTNAKNNINIHHNKVYDTQGFLETDAGGPYSDVRIAYNEADVSEKFIGMTNAKHWRVENNTIIRTMTRPPGYNDVNWFITGTTDTEWRNNIFVVANGLQAFHNGLGPLQIHDHNLFYSVDESTLDPIPGKRGNGDKVGDPMFVDFAKRDYHLKAGSPAIEAGTSRAMRTTWTAILFLTAKRRRWAHTSTRPLRKPAVRIVLFGILSTRASITKRLWPIFR
jgi:hypothetical protein